MSGEVHQGTRQSRIADLICTLDNVLFKATSVMAAIGMAALMLAVLVVVGDIIWRRIGGQSFIGAVDLTQLSVMAAASWSIPFAFSRKAHVTVDLLDGILRNGWARLFNGLAAFVGAGLMGFLFWLCWGQAMQILDYGDVSQDLAIPMIAYWTFLLSGLGVSMLVCAVQLLKQMLGLENVRVV